MTTAVYLLIYGAMLSWLFPPVLTRLTQRGVSPRLGVAAWVTAVVGVVLAWAVAITLIVVASLRGLPDSPALVLCLELLGVGERAVTPARSSVAVVIGIGLVISTVVTVKVGRSVLASATTCREHAHAARITGAPTDRPDVFVVPAEQPAAYCVVGRPNAIVVTTAAVDRLDDSQLAAVLAHEDAHISGRHHYVLMVLRALAESLPRLTLFTRGAVAVGELLEMCADDAAARRYGSRPLIEGMMMLAGPAPRGVAGLAVAATAVFVRANRLLEPGLRWTRWRHQLLMSATIALTVTAPVVVNMICHH